MRGETRHALKNIAQTTEDLTTPTIRLGVTGLARAGKTVFITSLLHNLITGGRLPLFTPMASGRLARAYLQPQPDDDVPRFDYEDHLEQLVDERLWPASTKQVSQLRLTIEYESATFLGRNLGTGRLHLDIVDYPGEWLLDLPLLSQDFTSFSAAAFARARARPDLAGEWLALLDANSAAIAAEDGSGGDEQLARALAAAFTDYLRRCRLDDNALSMLPPGRFLMPGEMADSPALTFCPLDTAALPRRPAPDSLHAMMQRRYEAYRTHVVKPFFKHHFAKLDRQVVLVDMLQALNAGEHALDDLQTALHEILGAFKPGSSSWLRFIGARRIDKILFAATKADHLQKEDHDKMQALLGTLVANASARASRHGAQVEAMALASVRATRQTMLRHDGDELPALIGTPLPGETLDGQRYDGTEQAALFPGDLPASTDPHTLPAAPEGGYGVNFVRFRPPQLRQTAEGMTCALPHIRMDRALDFLLGDKLA
ncbi:YcjX family protein [Pseudovibrio hongkongensis]|uniref:YcjX family protein n=1 Tax=Polycladidibacter hongkongensis TaxID=1647556 RepID=UPI00082C4043|nr:YcjX family protein [Pseudovibrio hongkongensis]